MHANSIYNTSPGKSGSDDISVFVQVINPAE
jgi:hypothetical protein